MTTSVVSRRCCLQWSLATLLARPSWSAERGTAFEARGLTFRADDGGMDRTVLATIGRELERRTSAPAVKEPVILTLGGDGIFDSPLLYAAGSSAIDPLGSDGQRQLRAFFALGGLLVLDDRDGGSGAAGGPFSRSVVRELGAVLPEASPLELDESHVLFRSFYLLRRVVGAKGSSPSLRAVARGNRIDAVIFRHDLSSALATHGSRWLVALDDSEREQAIRLAINLAMYSLCSTYKDDQVHAPFLMRRRAGGFPRR